MVALSVLTKLRSAPMIVVVAEEEDLVAAAGVEDTEVDEATTVVVEAGMVETADMKTRVVIVAAEVAVVDTTEVRFHYS